MLPFELVLSHVADGITVQDAQGRVVWANEPAARMCDYESSEQLLAAAPGEVARRFVLLDEAGRPVPIERLPGRLALAGQESPDALIRARNSETGRERWAVVRAMAVRDEGGRIVYAVNVFHDVTDLHRALRARDDFVSIASHELRSPMTAIQLLAETAQRRWRQDPAAQVIDEKLGELVRQIQRVRGLVETLLDVSRITESQIRLTVEDVDLARLTIDVATRHADEARRTGSSIEIHAPPSLVGRWDRLRLEQIVGNLLLNAIKYGRGKAIVVTVADLGADAALEVRDHGVGIATADQGRIFERFERAVLDEGGLGLGLWIVREIVDALGGGITVTSVPEIGSTFRVVLPRSAR